MSSFKGSYTYAVDDKGRINLPAKLRKYVSREANETFVVKRGFEQCLYVYPADEWNKLEQNLRNLSNYDAEHRRFVRTFL
jgi:MraZ protein